MNNTYKKYKAAGLCAYCGKAPPNISKTRCDVCHEKHLISGKKHRDKMKEANLCNHCRGGTVNSLAKGKSMCSTCLLKHANRSRESHQAARDLCVVNYGGKCACCGLAVAKYLQLDHVNNDGADHREKIWGVRRSGGSLAKWAEKNGFPNNLQLLCCNCHQAKTHWGGCTIDDHKAMNLSFS